MKIRCFTASRIHKFSIHFLFYNFIEFIIFLYNFLVIYFSWYKEYMIWQISFSKFSDVLPAFTCARVISNLWSIYLGVNNLIPLPFSCLLKSRIFEKISTILFGFSFLGISSLIIASLKSISSSLILFTYYSYLACLALIFGKIDGFWHLK